MTTLDMRTLFVCLTLVNVFLGLVTLAYWKTQKTYPGFGLWTACNLTIAAVYVLFSLRGAIPDFYSIVVASTLVALAVLLRLEGVKRFLGADRVAYRIFLLVPAAFIAHYLLTYQWDSPVGRSGVGAVFLTLFDWRMGWLLLTRSSRPTRPAYAMSAALFFSYGVMSVGRFVLWAVDPQARSLLAPNSGNALFFLLDVLFAIGWTAAFLILNSRRLTLELEAAQAGVEESRRRQADIIAFLPDPTGVVDRAGRVIAWNRAMEALTGVPAEAILGKGDYEYALPFYGERRPILVDLALNPTATGGVGYDRLERDNRTLTVEVTVDRLPGGPRTLWATAAPLVDSQGVIVGAIQSIRDMTARRQAEQALEASEQKYRELVELAQEGIWAIDAESRTTFVNPRMAEMLGYTVAEMAGSSLFDFMDEQGRAIADRNIERRRQGITEQHDFEFIRRDGTRIYASLATAPITDDEGRYVGVLAVVSDLTERRRLESQFIAAQKMETVARLAGGVAHQFNNVLTAVLGYADMAKKALPPGDPVRDDIDVVLRGSERLAKLTQELLAFSRRQVIRPAPLDLSDLVRGLEGVLDALPGERIERVNRLAPDLGWVQADRGRLEQVVLNLAANAHDAMPDGGRLTLETANVTLDETGELPAGDYVRLAVSDTGVGMSAEIQSHVFEPFFTTKDVGEGTGLALAAAYGIVRQHGGDLRVVSQAGQGARFEVYLPRLPV